MWDTAAVPGTVDWEADGNAVELGVKFRSDVAGSITGIRFYKASANTGTHVGNLWTSAGTLLASATFTGESTTGWQQVSFAAPVPKPAPLRQRGGGQPAAARLGRRNRWYLPGVGRYLELDPLATLGVFNGPHGPDWYGYAEGNPVIHTDPFGLDRYRACTSDLGWFGQWLCRRAVDNRCNASLEQHVVCCEADKHDCYTQKQPGCEGWEDHMRRCDDQYRRCVAEWGQRRQP